MLTRNASYMRRGILFLLLLAVALVLSACRFMVVESGSVRVEAPAPTPRVALTDLD